MKDSVEPLPRWPLNKGWFRNLAAALCFFNSDKVWPRSLPSSWDGWTVTTPPFAGNGVPPLTGSWAGTDDVVQMRPFCLLLPSLRMVASLGLSGSSTATTGLTCQTSRRFIFIVNNEMMSFTNRFFKLLEPQHQNNNPDSDFLHLFKHLFKKPVDNLTHCFFSPFCLLLSLNGSSTWFYLWHANKHPLWHFRFFTL